MKTGRSLYDGVTMAEGEPTQEPTGAADVSASESEPELPQINGFRVIQETGRSPKGVVYRARRLVEQDVVSVKVFRAKGTRSPKFRENLTDNAENSFLLEHPGLVRCLGCVEDGAQFMLIQEHAKGEPLARALQRNVRFMPPRALEIVRQCAEALNHGAERRRYHGRIHPGDLMLEDESVRILGVGLGEKPEHPAWETRDPHLFEPLIYTATEALPSRSFPSAEAGRRALDLYALGGILYHMLTGTPPFRGTDEGTLMQERAALSPLVVRWPRGTERSLPARAITLVERLLSPDPMARGDYHSLLEALKDALREAHGEELPPVQSVTPPLAPVEVAPKPAAVPPPPLPGTGAPPPVTYATGVHMHTRRGPERQRPPVLLIAAVAVVLAYALGLATRTFFFTASNPPEKKAAGADPEEKTPETPVEKPAPTPVQPALTREQQLAEAELKLLKELLDEGGVNYDRPLLRKLQDIATKAGETSKTGIQAQLLIEHVKEQLARAGTAPVPDVKKSTEAEERVFRDLLTRVQGLATERRFGNALTLLRELPASLKLAPYPERAAQESAKIQGQAQAAFVQVQTEAEKAVTAGQYAKARDLYEAVQLKWDMPKMAQVAEEQIRKIRSAQEKAFQTQAALRAQKARAREQVELAKLLRKAVTDAFAFRYKDAKDAMDAFVRAAQDPGSRELAAAYAKAIESESRLFELGRQRLSEKIQRDKVSPLQVLSSTDRKPLYDIVDFDQNGIRIAAVRGGVGGELVRAWEDWNPKQPFVMVQLLSDKANADERLALAVLAFHQSLRAESLAGEVKDDADKANGYRRTASDLKADAQTELNGAVQTDPGLRDKQAALRALFQNVAQLLANPPEAP